MARRLRSAGMRTASDLRGSRRHGVVLAVLSVVLLLVSGPATAQSTDSTTTSTVAPATGQSTLSVSPAIIDNAVDPGKSFESVITMSNITDKPMALRASAQQFASEETVDQQHQAAFDASAWFTIVQPDFLLLPSQQKQVNVSVQVPANAEPGGHYATVYFESFVPEQANAGASTLVNARVGVLVLITVRGDIREHVDSPRLTVESLQLSADPSTVTLRVRNDGNIHVLPQGSITIKDTFGKKVKEIGIPYRLVLPGTEREYPIEWAHGLRAGIYHADATITAGTTKTTLQAKSVTFVIVPLILVIPITLLVLSILIILFVPRIRKKRRAKAQAAQAEPTESDHGDESDEQ